MVLFLTTLAWGLALIFMVYLAAQAIRNVWRGRYRHYTSARKFSKFRKHHRFDEKRQRWVRNRDNVVMVDETNEDRQLRNVVLGCLLLIAWEVYWILEIVERVRTAPTSWQLPYVFLFIVLIGIPLVAYLFFRRMRRAARYRSRAF